MKPGIFIGILSTDWLNKDWERVHQCPSRSVRFAYITSDGRRKEPSDGFLTDLGSVPRFLQWWCRRDEFKIAFVLHDDGYDKQTEPRWQEDYDLNEMIYTMTCGYCFFKRNVIWFFVRLCGWWAWMKWRPRGRRW